MYCVKCSIENRDRNHFSSRVFCDKLKNLLVMYIIMFSIACILGGGDNMVACLLVNLVTNFIAKYEDWAEYTFSS